MSMPAKQLQPTTTLAELLGGIADAPDMAVSGIASDTRQLGEGYLFLACAGISSHGLDYAQGAVEAGASAIAYDADTATSIPDVDVPLIPVIGLRRQLGDIANRFFGHPSRSVKVVGVTGTNGKTTVAWLLSQCLHRLGRTCGYVGTLGYGIDEIAGGAGMTTPDVIELHRRLASFRDSGSRYAAIEVSSHALAQQRIDGVSIDTAMFTNLSRDHLDYHGDMKAYAEAKASLFFDAGPRHRIVNLDSEFGAELAARCSQDTITVSTNFDRIANGRPFVFLRATVAKEGGSEIQLRTSWRDGRLWLPLVGDFNIANALLVLAFLLNDGVAFDEAASALTQSEAPPGRMQRVAAPSVPAVYVDYAHSPHALEAVLRALRPHCAGKLWCVFGCGGDRDRGKRPLMARIAERLADRVVVTTDNPRSEDPAAIINDVVDGLTNRDAVTVIEDRGAAIAWTIERAVKADVILLAGKGHENFQLVGNERRSFSDYRSAAANLRVRERNEEGGS